jgi:hypothetical protein
MFRSWCSESLGRAARPAFRERCQRVRGCSDAPAPWRLLRRPGPQPEACMMPGNGAGWPLPTPGDLLAGHPGSRGVAGRCSRSQGAGSLLAWPFAFQQLVTGRPNHLPGFSFG